MDILNQFDITRIITDYLLQAYAICYKHLQQANIHLPPPDRIVPTLFSFFSFVIANAPSSVQHIFTAIQQVFQTSDIPTFFILLLLLYVVFHTILGSLRWVSRLLYGFVKFSLIVTTVITIVYAVQQFLAVNSSS
ncbi:hypothetical protein BDB01DRAFT_773948 [Pilobolus umbonatus]|nr:hypothetical protein BDB01DRAFT_773948 [Pilobolus umbonatus]